MRIYKSIFLFLAVILASSCTKEKTVFQKKTEFDYLGWNHFKVLEYKPQIKDISKAYIFTLKLELTDKYNYNYLRIQLSKTNGQESYVRVFSIPVKNQQNEFLEKAENGIYHITAILSRQIYFSSPGKYQISIKLLMPKFDTKGIKSVDFSIKKRNE